MAKSSFLRRLLRKPTSGKASVPTEAIVAYDHTAKLIVPLSKPLCKGEGPANIWQEMAKKSGKNIQKLLKKKRLQQLKEITDNPALEPVTTNEQPELKAKPELKKLPSGEGKPVIKTIVISAVIILVIFAVTYWANSSNYLDNFGNWLYESLRLNKSG